MCNQCDDKDKTIDGLRDDIEEAEADHERAIADKDGAIENLEDILSTDGVDAFFVGPYDLSGSLGIPGQLKHPKVIKSLEEVMKISKRHDVIPGFHVVQPDLEGMAMKIRQGYRFIGYSLDTLFLGAKCTEDVKAIRRKIKK